MPPAEKKGQPPQHQPKQPGVESAMNPQPDYAPRFPGGRSGYNDVLFWVAEAPSDSASRVEMRVACHRAQYLKPSFKDPVNGKIFLKEEDFYDLSDPEVLQRITDGEDICRGLEVR